MTTSEGAAIEHESAGPRHWALVGGCGLLCVVMVAVAATTLAGDVVLVPVVTLITGTVALVTAGLVIPARRRIRITAGEVQVRPTFGPTVYLRRAAISRVSHVGRAGGHGVLALLDHEGAVIHRFRTEDWPEDTVSALYWLGTHRTAMDESPRPPPHTPPAAIEAAARSVGFWVCSTVGVTCAIVGLVYVVIGGLGAM